MLYFHGNAEDVGHNMPLMYLFREKFKVSVLAVEYPGYGFFSHQILDGKVKPENQKINCNAKKLTTNSLLVFDFVIRPVEQGGLGYKRENVLVFGRSMGSGPSCILGK